MCLVGFRLRTVALVTVSRTRLQTDDSYHKQRVDKFMLRSEAMFSINTQRER
jgi:hypothetical protein